MTLHLLNRRICNINNKKYELYSTCISVLQNFGIFFRLPPKIVKFQHISQFSHSCMKIDNRKGYIVVTIVEANIVIKL
jgi:hypothetical protein